MRVTLVTGNPKKLAEARLILGDDLVSQSIDLPELQSMNLQEIVEGKMRAAFDVIGGPVLVEDISVRFPFLNGFPGPFVKYWEKFVGYDRTILLAQAEPEPNWSMQVRGGYGYKDAGYEFYVEHTVDGVLVPRRGQVGWGFDFYFVPDGETQTYAEMGPDRKCQISCRARGLRSIQELLSERAEF